jgi:hypothetical protein
LFLIGRFLKFFSEIDQSETRIACDGHVSDRNKNRLWRPCLLMDRDGISNFYRGYSIDAFYQVSVHLAKRFQRRFLEIDQSETKIDCGGHVC